MDLSVIVPIYNTPLDQLNRCFDSIQKIRDIRYEVVMIDDGSEEEIRDFCKTYALMYPNFRYFYQKNEGVSSARNNGIILAHGEYITFVDGDDEFIAKNLQKDLIERKFDLYIYNIVVKKPGKQILWKAFETNAGPIKRKDIIPELIKSSRLNSSNAKIIRRELLLDRNIKFDINMKTAEDLNFVIDLIEAYPSIYYGDKPLYSYYHSHGTRKNRINKFPDLIYENLIYIREKSVRLLESSELGEEEKVQIKDQIMVSAVEEIFNYCCDLYILKLLTLKRKAKIFKDMRSLEIIREKLPRKTEKKRTMILNRQWNRMKAAAVLRENYLKYIKK